MRRVLISTKPFIFVLFLVGVTVRSAESLSSAIPLGTSTKRANSKRANHGRSFSRCRFVRVLLVAVVSCLRMTDTIVVFSVWASYTLKMRSWMTHAPVVGVWAWFCCDLAFPSWKDWHPLPPPVLVSLARAEDRRLPSGRSESYCKSLSARYIPTDLLLLMQRTSRPVPGWFRWSVPRAPSISFGAPSVDRMSIAASGDGFTSSEDEGGGPGADGHACPGSREYRAGGQQTAQSRALAAGRLVSRSGARLTTALYSGAFLPGGAWGADEVVDGPFHGQKPLVRLLHPHYPRRRSGQGVRRHSPGGESDLQELRTATEFALRATKVMAFLGKAMSTMVVQERHLWLNLAEMKDADKARFLDALISHAGLFGDTVEGFALQFLAVQQQTEAIQHILPPRDAPSTAAPGARPQSPPELLRPRPNRQIGRRVEPLAGQRHPPRPSQAPSRPGSRRSGPDAGNPEMLEFALSQETARTAPLLPPVEGREENLLFHFVSVPRASGTHFLKERAISFSSGFSGPWDDSVRRPASSLSPTTHFASSQESTVRGRYSSPRTSGQSRLGPREFGEEASERTAFYAIHSYSLSLHHHTYIDCAIGAACTASGGVAHAAQPISLAHVHNSTRLRDSVRQATSQVQRRSRDVGVSPERPCLARGDCCPPGKGCNRAGPSSRDEAGVLQPLLQRTQERWWPSANPGSASLEPGFAQAPVQNADAQAHDQMHSAPGLVCSDRPEGRLLSRFDPSATQTVSTVCVRRSGMAVQGPPLWGLPVSPCSRSTSSTASV